MSHVTVIRHGAGRTPWITEKLDMDPLVLHVSVLVLKGVELLQAGRAAPVS